MAAHPRARNGNGWIAPPEDNPPAQGRAASSSLAERDLLPRPDYRMKIIYLGNPTDFDTDTARMIWRWLHEQTGNRGLIVIHEKANV